MPTKTQKLIEDVEFILAEARRLGALPIRDVPSDDSLIDIPHPGGGGRMLIGREASSRLRNIASELGARSGIRCRVERGTLYSVAAKVILKRLYGVEKLDASKFDRAMNVGVQRLKAACVDRVHFIPCHLMWANDPSELTIGPVTFHHRSSFRRRVLAAKQDQLVRRDEQHHRDILGQTLRYYRKFRWVAEVSASGFDPATSLRVAERAVTAALDCLHLLLSPRYTSGMQVRGPSTQWERQAHLCLTESGAFWPSTSTTAVGQVNFADGWSALIEQDDARHFLELFSVAVATVVNPDLVRPLARRFLDAAQWFGEAVRDPRAATSVVKYVMAIERMLMTDADKEKSDEAKDSITTNLSNRAAAICFDPKIDDDRSLWRKKISAAYDLRSRLVHGSMSPDDEEAELNRWEIADTARTVLTGVLDAFEVEGMEAEELSSTQLSDWFTSLVQRADRLEALFKKRSQNAITCN